MEISVQNGYLQIDSEKRVIQLFENSITLDGLLIDVPGEYEKSGSLCYAQRENEILYVLISLEGYNIGYTSQSIIDMSSSVLDFFGDLDILIAPTSKFSIQAVEKIEPRLLVTYGQQSHELGTHMGISDPRSSRYKLKDSDLSLDTMHLVLLDI